MAILPTFWERRERSRSKSSLPGDSDFWYSIAGTGTNAGVPISEETALKYLTVFSCVSLIAGDLGRLPLILYRRLPGGAGKERVVDHPLYDLLHTAPNPNTTSFHWREAAAGHNLLWGNHYSVVERNRYTGRISALWPIDKPGAVSVRMDKKKKKLVYRFLQNGRFVEKTRKDIFHVPGFGFNGLLGMSMISFARETIGLGLATEQFGAAYFKEGTHPSGIISGEFDLGENEEEYRRRLKESYAGMKNHHGIMLLQNGEKYTPLTVPMNDAQFLETRNFQKVEICGMYHVPPHKIAIHGQNSNYNNLEQENTSYVDSCLMHWITRYEQCISQQLLTADERRSGLFVEFLVDGLLRGDSQARGEYYNRLFQVGAISPNEIRGKENMNPDSNPAADQKYVQLNMVPLDMVDDLAKPAADKKRPAGEKKFFEDNEKTVRTADKPVERRAGVVLRDRITRQHYALFVRAAERIVNLEANAVKNRVEKLRKQRAVSEFTPWLDKFYADMPEKIKREFSPVFSAYMRAVGDASADEIGVDADSEKIDRFVSDYTDVFAKRHVSSSRGQLAALAADENVTADDLETRVNEWSETRPEKIAMNETVRAGAAVFQAVAWAAGLGTTWQIRGADTCPYCKELHGKVVRRGEAFLGDGDELDPSGGTGKMKIHGVRQHPPLHQGCDCYLSV